MNNVAELSEQDIENRLPKPVGYRLLVALPSVEETYEGTEIIKTSKEQHYEKVLTLLGCVIDMGDDAYKDKDRFPDGAWCKVGDFVMFRPNSGTRFKVDGIEYRLMNDDSIEAVVSDPTGITGI